MTTKQTGTVIFDTDPQGAIIYVDGQRLVDSVTDEIKRTPTSALLLEGRRDIVFKLEKYKDIYAYVDVFPNTSVILSRRFHE